MAVFEQANAVLELRNAKLQLVPVLARHEPELAGEVLDAPPRALPPAHRIAAPAGREVIGQGAQLVEPRSEDRDQALVGLAVASGLCHAGATSGAGGAVLSLLPSRRPDRSPLRLRRAAYPGSAPRLLPS